MNSGSCHCGKTKNVTKCKWKLIAVLFIKTLKLVIIDRFIFPKLLNLVLFLFTLVKWVQILRIEFLSLLVSVFLHYQSSNNVNKWILVTIYHSTTLNALLVITLTGISWSYFYLGKECSYVPTSRMLHRLLKPMTRSFGKCTLQDHFNWEQRIVEENLSIWRYSSFSMKDDGKIVKIHFYKYFLQNFEVNTNKIIKRW